jgi:UDP-glucose 4-epimerase
MDAVKIGFTGASGMVGRHLIDVLNRRSIAFIASSRRPPHFCPSSSAWKCFDLREKQSEISLDNMFSNVTSFVHMGAVIPQAVPKEDVVESFETNVAATLYLARWALKRKIHFVYLSSATVYSHPDRENILETDPTSLRGLGGFYKSTKAFSEEILFALKAEGLSLCMLRPSSIYGHGLPKGKAVCQFLETASLNQTLRVSAPANDRINMIHAQDVAEAIFSVVQKGAAGVFNIASERSATILELAEICVAVTGKGRIEVTNTSSRREPRVRFGLNTEAARDTFGFEAKLDLNHGIKTMWRDSVLFAEQIR